MTPLSEFYFGHHITSKIILVTQERGSHSAIHGMRQLAASYFIQQEPFLVANRNSNTGFVRLLIGWFVGRLVGCLVGWLIG